VLCAALGIFCADQQASNPFIAALAVLLFGIVLLRWPAGWAVRVYVIAAFFVLHTFHYWDSPGRLLARELKGRARSVEATGVVISEQEAREDAGPKSKTSLRAKLGSIRAGSADEPENAIVLLRWIGSPPAYGDLVSFKAPAGRIAPARNPGQFDYAGYMNRLGVYTDCEIRDAADEKILGHGHGNPIRVLAYNARGWLQAKLSSDLEDSPEIAGLIQSLVLGLKSETPEATRELFQRTGTLHLFVVNGLHVGMFAAIAWLLLAPLGLSRRLSVFVLVPLLAFYAVITGLSTGSIRATIMAAIVLGGYVVERKPVALNSLAAAAFVILAWDTNELFMPGFQFSFGVVSSIILLAGRLQRAFSRWGEPDCFLPRQLWSARQRFVQAGSSHAGALLAVSTAAWIGSLPFTAGYIHLVTLSSVAANFVIVPTAFCILFNGILAIVSGTISTALGNLFNNANWLAAHLLLWLVQLFARIPGGYVYVETPRLSNPPCEMTVLDLNGGGAMHVRAAGSDWLIDTGNGFEYDSVVRPFLRMRGINSLDGLVLTQGNAKHIGAASQAWDDFQPDRILDSPLRESSRTWQDYEAGLPSPGVGRVICQRGDLIDLSPEAKARILYPPPGISPKAAGDKTLIIRIECRGVRLLLAQESGTFAERWLIEHEADLASDVLVKGAQGKDVSGLDDFLKAVRPAVLISTAPRGADPLETRARACGAAFFPQARTGAVRIEIGESELTVSSYLGDEVFRKSIR
jgi:competence protein ComEC